MPGPDHLDLYADVDMPVIFARGGATSTPDAGGDEEEDGLLRRALPVILGRGGGLR